MGKGNGESKCIRKTRERLSVLERDSGYRERCAARRAGFTDPSGAWEAHHILCNHAIEGRRIAPEHREYVEDCLWVTAWNLNNAKNLIGLPLNRQYRKSRGKKPQNLCSHQVDHNTSGGYTSECEAWLRDNVWDTLNDRRKNHDVEARRIQQELERGTARFASELERRGQRRQGTEHCWKHRFEPEYAQRWYFPFSMAAAPRPRCPGLPWDRLRSVFQQLKPEKKP